jgi:hypothetical protein
MYSGQPPGFDTPEGLSKERSAEEYHLKISGCLINFLINHQGAKKTGTGSHQGDGIRWFLLPARLPERVPGIPCYPELPEP